MRDLISRQDAIDAFDKQNWSLLNIPICKEIRKAAKDTIRALSGVQPEPQWIPVGKKYPPVGEEVLVTYSIDRRKRRYVYTAYWNGNDWLSVWDEYRAPDQSIRYHAWMPLPKPYKEDKT